MPEQGFEERLGGFVLTETIAKIFRVTPETIRSWRRQGRKNPFTGEVIRAQMTWMPNGGWGMTKEQFDQFIAELNQKP